MTMTDPIADLLTRIRNANTRGLGTVDIPASGQIGDLFEIDGELWRVVAWTDRIICEREPS